MRILMWWLTNSGGLALAAYLLNGISFAGPQGGTIELQEKAVPLLIVAGVLTVIGFTVKPFVKVLSLPLIILTLGLFLIIINAGMLMLTDWIVEQTDLGIGFHVATFTDALLAALIITGVTIFVEAVAGGD